MRYNSFFENLVRGHQQEFYIYYEVYKATERLFGKINLNIYDQVADIDGIDFLIRCETEEKVIYFEGQVKKAKGKILYKTSKNSLREQSLRAVKNKTNLLIFVVDYEKKGLSNNPEVYFYTAHELEKFYQMTQKNGIEIVKLNTSLTRDTTMSYFSSYVENVVSGE